MCFLWYTRPRRKKNHTHYFVIVQHGLVFLRMDVLEDTYYKSNMLFSLSHY